MKTSILILVVALVFSCSESDKPSEKTVANPLTTADSQSLRKVYEEGKNKSVWLDSIANIDFVVKSNRYIDSFSNHKHGIAFLLDTTKNGEVNISAGYNGDQRFETYYSFILNKAATALQVLDRISGERMSVDAFRKTLK